MDTINEPENRISKDAVIVWRTRNIIGEVVGIILLGGLLWAALHFDWYRWVIVILWVLIGLTPVLAIWSIFIEPVFSQKYWRYGIDEEFIQLKHGVWNETHLIIPMTKVQYVGVKQGPLFRKYGLYTLTIGTMWTSHFIPALPEQEALNLRDQVAHYAKIKEVE